MNKTIVVRIKSVLVPTFITVVAATCFTACCSGVDNPDDLLQVELTAEATDESEVPARLCGAEVFAVDGEERIALEEIEEGDGCVYRGQVDPEVAYTIEASHPDYGNGETVASSNPACSTRTDPKATDESLTLGELVDQVDDRDQLQEGELLTAEAR